MIKLSPRLQIIYDMVPPCATVADVGCDHGYLAMALLKNDIADRAIAMDVNIGPLQSARQNINEAGLSSRADLRLSDGLCELEVDEADVVCICGMGGALIRRILDADIDVARSVLLILEPQSEYRSLRTFLMDRGFRIIDEDLCIEENKIYPIIKATYDPDSKINYQDYQLEYGPVIIKKNPALLGTLLEKKKREYSDIIDKLSNNPSAQTRINELQYDLDLIQQVKLDLKED